MTTEITKLLNDCKSHLENVEVLLNLGQPMKAEFRARALKESAALLSNVLFRVSRTSGEVK